MQGAYLAKWRRRSDVAIVALFVAALAAPHVDHLVRDDAARGPFRELRKAATRPKLALDVESLMRFPAAYESYWNDAFGLRDLLLRLNGALDVFAFGISPSDAFVLGEDHWIFVASENAIEGWRGAAPFAAGELAAWRAELEQRRAICEQHGARYLYVVAPDKTSIYPERLPKRFAPIGPSRLDQWLGYLRAESDVDILDLRPALRDAASHDRDGDHVYFELGSHWRTRGTLAACRAIFDHLRPAFDLKAPIDLEDHVLQPTSLHVDDVSRQLYVDGLLTQDPTWRVPRAPGRFETISRVGIPRRLTTRGPDPAAPSAIVFHDSFGPYVEPYLAEAFSRLLMAWDGGFDPESIAAERPDLVIEIYVERALNRPIERVAAKAGAGTPASEFEAARDVRYRLDLEQGISPLVPLYGATVRVERDAGSAFLAIDSRGALDALALPELAPLDTGRLWVRIDVEAPRDTRLAIYYQRADEGYREEQRVTADLTAGRSVVHLPLDAPLAGALLLSPGRAPGRYAIRALEIRALEMRGLDAAGAAR
jgi:alginate O-acetyltransferase complex protein AlgJ